MLCYRDGSQAANEEPHLPDQSLGFMLKTKGSHRRGLRKGVVGSTSTFRETAYVPVD